MQSTSLTKLLTYERPATWDHKFVTNSREVLESIPVSERAKEFESIDLQQQLPSERALGLKWNTKLDTFTFQTQHPKGPFTRRQILSTITSIFDPFGYIAPFNLVGKQLLQVMCKEGTDWNSAPSNEIQTQWQIWTSELTLLENLHVPRWLLSSAAGHTIMVQSDVPLFSPFRRRKTLQWL